MRFLFAALLALAAHPLAAASAAAQGISPLSVETRAALAVPVDGFASRSEIGGLLEATIRFAPIPFVAAYAGWTLADFGIDAGASVAGLDTRMRDTGFRAGAELSVPLAGLLSGVAPYVHGGIIFNRARVRVAGDGTSTLARHSERTRGHEAGVGARIKLLRRISIVPEMRYRSYEPGYGDDPPGGADGRLTYLSAGLGLAAHF